MHVTPLATDRDAFHRLIRVVRTGQPFPLAMVGFLVFHSLSLEDSSRVPAPNHLLLYHAKQAASNSVEDADAFAFISTQARQRTSIWFWFREGPGCGLECESSECKHAQREFAEASVKHMFSFAEKLPDPAFPDLHRQMFINFVEDKYIPLLKRLCVVSWECQPHNALVFDEKHAKELDESVLAPGTRFVVGDEAFVMDNVRSEDVDFITTNNKYSYYRPYIQEMAMHPILNPLHRIIRALPSLDAEIPSDMTTLKSCTWCLVHPGFSIGVNWTMPDFRRKGLAYICSAAVTKSYRDFAVSSKVNTLLDALEIPRVKEAAQDRIATIAPHCYTQLDNPASVPMFKKIGYRVDEKVAVDWIIAELK